MWYAARILFESRVEDARDASLVEHSIRLVRAADEAEARAKAEAIGRSDEVTYQNEAGRSVTWQFAGVAEIQDLCEPELHDGMEVFSILRWNRRDSDQLDDASPPNARDQATAAIRRTAGALAGDDDIFEALEQIRRDRRLDPRREVDLDG
jgi:hypothetical protein